jgi:hypothetical protein
MGNVYDIAGKMRPTDARDKKPIRYAAGPFPLEIGK